MNRRALMLSGAGLTLATLIGCTKMYLVLERKHD